MGSSTQQNFAPEKRLEEQLPALTAFVRLRIGGLKERESASDLVQSICRELVQHPETYQHPDNDFFKRWLYGTAERKIVDHFRFWEAQKRDKRKDDRDGTALSEKESRILLASYRGFLSPSRAAVGQEEIQRIEKAFDSLPQDYRDVILLSRIQELSRKEVAEKMGKSEASIRSLLSRALVRLAELLDQE